MANRFGISTDARAAERIDLALTRPPFELSRREAKRVLAAGRVLIDSRPVSFASRPVGEGKRVTLLAEGCGIDSLLLTDDLIAINKPDGIPTQPSPGSANPSLLELVSVVLKTQSERPDLFLIHRLDTNTTGVILFARTPGAAALWSARIAGRECSKRYLALVEGRIESDRRIDAPIARVDGNLFGISVKGKPAQSDVRVLEAIDHVSLLEVNILTGRTHQIRVHLASIGHPVCGDRKYGNEADASRFPRTMLHSWQLVHPAIGNLEAPIPVDFTQAARLCGIRAAF